MMRAVFFTVAPSLAYATQRVPRWRSFFTRTPELRVAWTERSGIREGEREFQIASGLLRNKAVVHTALTVARLNTRHVIDAIDAIDARHAIDAKRLDALVFSPYTPLR